MLLSILLSFFFSSMLNEQKPPLKPNKRRKSVKNVYRADLNCTIQSHCRIILRHHRRNNIMLPPSTKDENINYFVVLIFVSLAASDDFADSGIGLLNGLFDQGRHDCYRISPPLFISSLSSCRGDELYVFNFLKVTKLMNDHHVSLACRCYMLRRGSGLFVPTACKGSRIVSF